MITTGRQQRGQQIATTEDVRQCGSQWLVPSQSQPCDYVVTLEPTPRCSCPDHRYRGKRCKHIIAVLLITGASE